MNIIIIFALLVLGILLFTHVSDRWLRYRIVRIQTSIALQKRILADSELLLQTVNMQQRILNHTQADWQAIMNTEDHWSPIARIHKDVIDELMSKVNTGITAIEKNIALVEREQWQCRAV